MTTATIDKALRDKRLLGAALGNPAPWTTWLAVLRAAFGQSLSQTDQTRFDNVAGHRPPPSHRVRELWAVVGRGGGKSRIAAALAIFVACFQKHDLAPGEIGHVLVLAASRDQAGVVFGYVKGFLEASAVLRGEIESVTATEIRLSNGLVIAVHAGSFRTIRGRTLLAAIFDEVSFWRDETSATPDIETYRAVLPSLARTRGMLIGISTPYRKLGLLHQKHRDHFGVNDADVLVVQGPALTFNPTLDAKVIDAARAVDPEAAHSEWDAQFRSDLAAFLDEQTITSAIEYGRPEQIAPQPATSYRAFCDPSGGRHDAFTLAIGHKEQSGCVVADVILGRKAPFDPQAVTKEFATLIKEYKCNEVTGDNYSAAWAETAFRDAGLRYQRSELNRSALYLEGLPLFMRGVVSIPDHAKLIKELRLLERRTSRVGKDAIDHGRNGSDDYANALFGMLYLVAGKRPMGEIFAAIGRNHMAATAALHSATLHTQQMRHFH